MSRAQFQSLFLISMTVVLTVACSSTDKTESDSDAKAQGRDSVVVEMVAQDSISVFELLRQKHQVEYRRSTMGYFVTAIDSVEQGGGYFWLYSVNDSVAPIASDKQIVLPGDTVRWRLHSR